MKGFASRFAETENGSATQLNSASQLVWSLCDGQRRVRQIVRFIKEEYPDAGDEVRQDVVQVVRKLRRQGLVEQVET